MRTNLKACAIINFIFAAFLTVTLKWFSIVHIVFLVATGAIYWQYSNSSIEKLQKNKNIITILALISMFFNFITAIILLLARDQIKNEYINFCNDKNYDEKLKEKVSPEVKKIDTLLKLGAGMVFISGLIFSTTNWEIVSNTVKVIILIFMGIMFCVLSKFTEVKLKLKNSTTMYWILGMLFFILSFVSGGYFETFGQWFSIRGEVSQIYFMTLCLFTSMLSFITYKKFNINMLLYIIFSGILLSLMLLLDFIGISINVNLLIAILSITLLTLLKKNDDMISIYFDRFLAASTYILTFLVLFLQNGYIFSLTSTILIINLLFITFKTKTIFSAIYTSTMCMILIPCAVSELHLYYINAAIIIGSIYMALYTILMLTKLLDKNKIFKNAFPIVVNVAVVFIFLSGLITAENSLLIVISILSLISSIVALTYNKDEKIRLEYYMQPLKVIAVTLAITGWLNAEVIRISGLLRICISSIIVLMVYYAIKDEKLKYKYFISVLYTLIFTLFMDLFFKDFIVSVFLLVAFPLIFAITKLNANKEYKNLSILSFALTILSIYLIFVNINILNILKLISCISVIIMYLLIMLICRKEKVLFNVVSFVILLPFAKAISFVSYNIDIRLILGNMLSFYLLFLLCRNLVNSTSDKNILLTAISIIIMLPMLFRQSLLIGIYIGIVGLIILFYSFSKSEYRTFFIFGIVLIISNIVIQLRGLWSRIPFWLYLLIAGLSLIGFVTYKESKKIEK